MNTFESLAARVSVRDFESKPIPRGDLEEIVTAALYAPVGMKMYDSLHITVLSTPKRWRNLPPRKSSRAAIPSLIPFTAREPSLSFRASGPTSTPSTQTPPA